MLLKKKEDFSLMKIVVTPLAKIVLMLLGLTAAISATDAAIQKNKENLLDQVQQHQLFQIKK